MLNDQFIIMFIDFGFGCMLCAERQGLIEGFVKGLDVIGPESVLVEKGSVP
jgi:hypothetical protein